MTKVKEEVTINVNENQNSVKDLDYSVTLDSDEGFIITDLINGVLEAVIIRTSKNCEIYITFEGLDVVLYENVDFFGLEYLPLRLNAISKENERFNFSPQKWILNNKLEIRVRGVKNTQVDITLRCSNA